MVLTVLLVVQYYLYQRHDGSVEGTSCENLRGPIGWANFILVGKLILALFVYFNMGTDPEDRTAEQRKFHNYLEKAN